MLSNQVTTPDNLILISKSLMIVLVGHLSAFHVDVWSLPSLAFASQRERYWCADCSIHQHTRLLPSWASESKWRVFLSRKTQVMSCARIDYMCW